MMYVLFVSLARSVCGVRGPRSFLQRDEGDFYEDLNSFTSFWGKVGS